MSSRFLSLAALSGLLLITGTGCSQVSSRLSEEASDAVQAVDEVLTEDAQAAEQPTPEASPEPPEAEPNGALVKAQRSAEAAAATEQTAVTDNDWNRAASQWKAAIAYAASVPEGESDRDAAQTKAAEYSRKLTATEEKYTALVRNRYEVFSTSPNSNAGVDNTYEADGKRVRAWIQTGEFSNVEALLKEAVQQKKLTRGGAYYADAVLRVALGGDDVVFSPDTMAQLNQWVEKSPSNPYAYITRAYANQAFIWVKPYLYEQGKDGQASDPRRVNLEDAEALGTPLTFSLLDTEKALKLSANHPLALLSELRLARLWALGSGEEKLLNETFNKVDQVLPFAFETYMEKTIYLLSKDKTGGEALNFLRRKVGSAPSNSAMPITLAITHFALQTENTNAREYLNKPEVWTEIQENSERVMAAYPQEGIYAGWYAYLAHQAGRSEIARKYSQVAISRDASSAELQTWLQIMN